MLIWIKDLKQNLVSLLVNSLSLSLFFIYAILQGTL